MDTTKLLDNLKSDISERDCSDYLNGTYKKLAQLIGVEAVLILHSEFGGGYLTLPRKLLSDVYVHQCILDEYDGTNARQLAKDWDCTYSWILKILKRKRETEDFSAEYGSEINSKAIL